MSLKTQRAGFKVVLIQLPNHKTKALQDVGFILDCFHPSCKMATLIVQEPSLPHHRKKERFSLVCGPEILGIFLTKPYLVMSCHTLNQKRWNAKCWLAEVCIGWLSLNQSLWQRGWNKGLALTNQGSHLELEMGKSYPNLTSGRGVLWTDTE